MLALFEVYSETPADPESPIETKKEQAARKERQAEAARNSSTSLPRIDKVPRASMRRLQLNSKSDSNRAKLVFDFGLIMQQCMTFYAGLMCSVTVKH